MKFKIEKNVPFPTAHRRTAVTQLEEEALSILKRMKVGDSFSIAGHTDEKFRGLLWRRATEVGVELLISVKHQRVWRKPDPAWLVKRKQAK